MPALWLLAVVLVLGMLAGLSPTKAATTIMLLGKGTLRWPRVIAFAAGSTTVILVIAIVAGLSGITVESIGGSRRLTGLINLVLGMILVAVAVVGLVRSRRQRAAATVPDTAASEPAQQPSRAVASAFGLGAGETVQAVGKLILFAAAVNEITATALPGVLALAYFVILVVLTQLPVWGPAALFVRSPDHFARVSVEVDRRLAGPGSPVLLVLTAAVGIGLIIFGILLLGGMPRPR
jgi:hypothetical protein